MLLWVAVGLCFGVEWRVRGVDCVCFTEPPCSSDSKMGKAGFASLAQVLKKNTTLQELTLIGEFVVLCIGRGVDCCGLLLWAVVDLCFGVEGRVRGVDCVRATEPPCSSDIPGENSEFEPSTNLLPLIAVQRSIDHILSINSQV